MRTGRRTGKRDSEPQTASARRHAAPADARGRRRTRRRAGLASSSDSTAPTSRAVRFQAGRSSAWSRPLAQSKRAATACSRAGMATCGPKRSETSARAARRAAAARGSVPRRPRCATSSVMRAVSVSRVQLGKASRAAASAAAPAPARAAERESMSTGPADAPEAPAPAERGEEGDAAGRRGEVRSRGSSGEHEKARREETSIRMVKRCGRPRGTAQRSERTAAAAARQRHRHQRQRTGAGAVGVALARLGVARVAHRLLLVLVVLGLLVLLQKGAGGKQAMRGGSGGE